LTSYRQITLRFQVAVKIFEQHFDDAHLGKLPQHNHTILALGGLTLNHVVVILAGILWWGGIGRRFNIILMAKLLM
jgi:hypothetical protein